MIAPPCAVPTVRETPVGWRIRLRMPGEETAFLDGDDARVIADRLELWGMATPGDCPRVVARWCALLRRLAVLVDRKNRKGDA